MPINLKNAFLVLTLISLCFLIKCKLDADRSISAQQKDPTTSASKISVKPIEKNIEENRVQNKSGSENYKVQPDTASIKKPKSKNQEKPKKTASTIKTATPKATKKKISKTLKKAVKHTPKIEFEEMMWDFGEITEGDIIKKKFKFTNTGKAPLQIIGADASCGCARPTVPFLDIAPGESSEIGITYNSVNKDGDQKPEIIIESNTYPRHNVLKLMGKVKPKTNGKEEIENKKEVTIDTLDIKRDTTIKN